LIRLALEIENDTFFILFQNQRRWPYSAAIYFSYWLPGGVLWMGRSIEFAPDLPLFPCSDETRRYRYAFQIAWYLHPNPEIASAIAREALAGLPQTYEAQARRAEYVPKGEFRTRISMEPDDLILRRVFALSGEYEDRRERSGKLTKQDLIVYFIKEVLRDAFKHSSFHAMVAAGRVLHSYRTQDVMQMYGTISPERSIKKNDGQYRTWKKKLMDRLEKRFKPYASTFKGPRGEKRFIPESDEKILIFAQDCLRQFTPLQASHVIPERCGTDAPEHLSYQGPADGEHRTELQRVHACICPDCFERLTKTWNLDKPVKKLAIPAFALPPEIDSDYFDRNKPPVFTDAEVGMRLAEIAAEKERRQRVSPESLRVLVNGRKKAKLKLNDRRNISIKLNEDDEIIQLVSEEGDILVTHLVSFRSEETGFYTTSRYEAAGLILDFVDNPAHAEDRTLEIRVESKPQRGFLVLAGGTGHLVCGETLFWPLIQAKQYLEDISRAWHKRTYDNLFKKSSFIMAELFSEDLDSIACEKGIATEGIGRVSAMRALVGTIDALTHTQAKLYERYCVLALKQGVGLDAIPHVDGYLEKLSRNSFWAGITMLASGIGLLSANLPLLSLVPLSVSAFALYLWQSRKWSSHLTEQYALTTQRLDLLQEILNQRDDIDSVRCIRKLYADGYKHALLVGDDREKNVGYLAECLEANRYMLHYTHQQCNLKGLDLKAKAMSLGHSSPGIILIYFSGHGTHSTDFCNVRNRFNLRSRNLVQRPILFAGSDLCDGVFRWSELQLSAFRSPLSFFNNQGPTMDRKRDLTLTGIVADGLKGAAAGPEGLITFSDLAWYVKKRLSNPELIREIGQWTISSQYSDHRSGDILLGDAGSRLPFETKEQ
jgi:hypothetical protein